MNKYFSFDGLVACFISAHSLFFLFSPVNLSSLAHCDDVVFVIITIDLSKLFHCRKFLFFYMFFFLCYVTVYRDRFYFADFRLILTSYR